jgi:hypothetical protein
MKGIKITMTNEILRECNEKYADLKIACDLVKDELEAFEDDLEVVAEPLNTDVVSIDPVKIEFGDMFTGCLTPVNGHNIKDRRYFDDADGTPTSDFNDARNNSPAVWKGIGKKRSYKKNTTWFQPREIFDKISQEHVDLIHNGKYSRRDHKEVAQDFLDIRNKINAISADLSKKEVACTPDSPLPISLYFIDDGYSAEHVVKHLFEATITGWDVTFKGITVEIDPSEELEAWDNYEDGSHTIEFANPEPIGRMGYGNKFYMEGLVPIFKNQDTIDAKKALDLVAQGILEEMDTLKHKYANRLVVKGIF